MMAQLDKPMKISTLSATVGLSNSSFFDRFKNATGQTPLNLFIRARMRWAGELLEQTTLQIQEVAGRVGYDDQFYFSRLFKAVHGRSPRDYRAQKRSQSCELIGDKHGPTLSPALGSNQAKPTSRTQNNSRRE
jgi:transcriptional regulator GlxA family with amidase domain